MVGVREEGEEMGKDIVRVCKAEDESFGDPEDTADNIPGQW